MHGEEQEKDTELKNRWPTEGRPGWEEGGADWEFRIDIRILLYLKQSARTCHIGRELCSIFYNNINGK